MDLTVAALIILAVVAAYFPRARIIFGVIWAAFMVYGLVGIVQF